MRSIDRSSPFQRSYWHPVSLLILFVLAACVHTPETRTTPAFSLEVSVRADGTATAAWTEGIAIAIGNDAAAKLARERIPFTPEARAWLQVLRDAMPLVASRGGEWAALFDVALLDPTIVVGNRGSSDGFGWEPRHIGINVQAFAETYGPPDGDALDRMVRIVSHEYLHLLTYAYYEHHRELRQTPLDRALWTIFFEGIGDYVSMSNRWLPDEDGTYSSIADVTLGELEPVFVERLEQLASADAGSEPELRAGIAMGRFNRKWGSLPFALWLHSEVRECGESETLRAVFQLQRDGVLALAERHAAAVHVPRLRALRSAVGRKLPAENAARGACLATDGPSA